ncbi:MAG: Sir2 family NAD-dependent protein deacetylase [Syntrophales bacterium]|jgi:NAD-dependent deacetylase|nr:Sir2 family NAD-dependent protein deacetylase [Syntrophales bacterium]MDY0045075.1 Sir2 family NAD-dependent protein deacetylase [Syntrophales bacterium]
MNSQDIEAKIDAAAAAIVASKRIVVFTGAGVSTESGIPDFRSPGGIWTKFDPEDFTIEKFLTSRDSRKKQWEVLLEGGLFGAVAPNPAHYAIAQLEKLGKLDCIITQNIDNLHQKAGNSPDIVFELHGNMQWVICMHCGKRYSTETIIEKLQSGIEIPDCDHCLGILKPDVVFFGESLPFLILNTAIERSKKADLFISIGSSLVVTPAAYMPSYALESGAKLIIVNIGETSLDNRAHILINGKAGDVMTRILEKVSTYLCV